MDERTRAALILCLCMCGGAAIGYVAGVLTTGLLVGFIFGMLLTGGFRRNVKWTKEQRRIVIVVALAMMMVVGFSFGILTGDYVSGLGSAVAMSLVVVLKMEKLFDERIGALFSKAGRDGFVAANLAFAALLFAARLFGDDPLLASLTPTLWVLIAAATSWGVFLVSATYHAYVKGE
jgi:hypothetical protein